MWISQKNEECQGQTSDQSSPQSRSQEIVCLKQLSCFSFPKSARLRKPSDFQKLKRFGHQVRGCFICCQYHIEGSQLPRLGITVSKKYGKACKRNYFKRIVRESFRQLLPILPIGLSLNIFPLKKSCSISKKNVEEDIKRCFENFSC